ncbi:hypothetical protein R3P38DRAFT_3238568 [Favolaschia claudopus]|uniref:Uncharacterized protein n=1 Tax=Favolaschia claudopus TaxID=2862362 RepID=A0AAV9ZAM6_9AGAR
MPFGAATLSPALSSGRGILASTWVLEFLDERRLKRTPSFGPHSPHKSGAKQLLPFACCSIFCVVYVDPPILARTSTLWAVTRSAVEDLLPPPAPPAGIIECTPTFTAIPILTRAPGVSPQSPLPTSASSFYTAYTVVSSYPSPFRTPSVVFSLSATASTTSSRRSRTRASYRASQTPSWTHAHRAYAYREYVAAGVLEGMEVEVEEGGGWRRLRGTRITPGAEVGRGRWMDDEHRGRVWESATIIAIRDARNASSSVLVVAAATEGGGGGLGGDSSARGVGRDVSPISLIIHTQYFASRSYFLTYPYHASATSTSSFHPRPPLPSRTPAHPLAAPFTSAPSPSTCIVVAASILKIAELFRRLGTSGGSGETTLGLGGSAPSSERER